MSGIPTKKPKQNTLKVVVIGDPGVGKTCLMQRYMNGTYSSEYRTTVGADFLSTKITVNETTYNLQVWDTAGQEKFQAIGSAFYRGADCCIVVFDVTNGKSFSTLGTWMNEFSVQGEVNDPATFPFVIIGNKIDKAERAIETEQGQQYAASKNLGYFETSAKENQGITEAFDFITKQAVARNSKTAESNPPTGSVVNLKNAVTKKPTQPEGCTC